MYEDSPCRTSVGNEEAQTLKDFLKSKNLHFKTVYCLTSNVFCIHHYLIAPIEEFEKAKEIVKQWYADNKYNTRLIYAC